MRRSNFSTYLLNKLEGTLNRFSQTKHCQIVQCFFMYIGVYLVTLLLSTYLSSFIESKSVALAIGVLVWAMGYALSLYADYRTPLMKLASVVSVFGFTFASMYFGALFVMVFAALLTYQDYQHVYAPLHERRVF